MTKLVNRAKMTTATTGTGAITLGSAVAGYQSFAAAGVVNGDVVRYVIEDGNNWEIGTGTYTASGTTLSRTPSESSNADATISLSGNAVVYVSATSQDVQSDVDINGGTIDGAVIGGSSPAALTATTGVFNTSITMPDWLFHAGDGNTYFGFPGNDTFSITVGGVDTLQVAPNVVAMNALTTEDRRLVLGGNRTGNGNSYIDLIGDATYTGAGAGLRVIRGNTGANATSSIVHRGTGPLQLQAVEAGIIQFLTTNLERMRINPGGNVGIGTASPATALDVNGTITATGWSGGGIVTETASQTLTNKTLTDPAITGTILEDVYTITDGAAFEIDPGNGSVQLITLGASRTPKATNFAAGEAITLMVDDGSAYTITWTDATFGGSGVIWKTDGGVAPTLNTTDYTAIVLWKVGTQVYGARVGDA